ncbi:MAG: hypothetical protein K1X90_08135 [Candidatus Kapabacteria bacterium]|nr:hypothetical protein [Candidatus Kapabacteria bacterium]
MSMNHSQIRGLVVVLLLVGGAVAAWLLNRTTYHGVRCEAWFEGVAGVDRNAPIMFHRAKIGFVDSVVYDQVGLQLVIRRNGLPLRSQTITLQSGQVAEIISAKITLRFDGSALAVATPTSTFHVEPMESLFPEKTQWLITGATAGDVATDSPHNAILLEGEPLAKLPRDSSWKGKVGVRIKEGERLGVGQFTIQWNPPAVFTRVVAAVDTAILAEQLGGRSGFGVGAGLRLSSNFGITQPTLAIEPSFAQAPIVAKQWGQARGDSTPELSAIGGFDLEAVASNLTDYAFSRSRINSPPANRYERVLFDLNNTLANIDSITDEFNTFAATPEGVQSAPRTRLDFIIHNIQDASDDLTKTLKDVSTMARDVDTAAIDLKKTTIPQINRTLLDAQAAIERIQLAVFELQQLSQRIRTGTLPHLENDVDEVNADVTRISKAVEEAERSLHRLINDIRRKLP